MRRSVLVPLAALLLASCACPPAPAHPTVRSWSQEVDGLRLTWFDVPLELLDPP